MEQRIEKLIVSCKKRLSHATSLDSRVRLEETITFLGYIKTGKRPTYFSGILHII